MMDKEVTVWALNAATRISDNTQEPVYQYRCDQHQFDVHLLDDSLWILCEWDDKSRIAFRTAYAPGGLSVDEVVNNENSASFNLTASSGKFTVEVDFPPADQTMLHYVTRFTANAPLSVPFWPKDVLVLNKRKGLNSTDGEVYVRQEGIRTGLLYSGINKPGSGSFLYFQNLTSMNEYCQETETSLAYTVGGQWPELGFSLPATKEKPLPAGKEFIISDAYVSLGNETPGNQFDIARQYIDHLANVYKLIPKPDTTYQDFPTILNNSLHDLTVNKGCWSQHKGCSYLNAYVCDYVTPPEIMVQLAVLLPVTDYTDWNGDKPEFANQIYDNIHTFYNEDLKTIKRWLPAVEDSLDESEEQKSPNVMDAWYLHHPLLNLGRLALRGDKLGKELFLNSIDYAIKVAQKFDYKWPVFYDMRTLEVLKEETQPGEGGEKDVAGVYAMVMLQAYDITGEKRFMDEAKKAAKSLAQFGFDIFYQANNTTFSTKALLRLYQETKEQIYLDICYLLIANILKNVAIWECNYGYGENYPLFFGLFPLNDAPYMAVYEEQESFAAMHDLLEMAKDDELSDNVRLLLSEYIKYMINRAAFYCPPMLPKEMLSDEVKTGEIDKKLWVALEDLHDGWEQAGAVGQEVYGAGLCFGIVPRHYILIPGQSFMVYCEYPVAKKVIKDNTLALTLLGSGEIGCKLCIIDPEGNELPGVTVLTGAKKNQQEIEGQVQENGSIQYQVQGNESVLITWEIETVKKKR